MIPWKRFHWTTQDEIKFLQGLGGWETPGEHARLVNRTDGEGRTSLKFDPIRRLRLLKSYKQSIPLRKDWGNIIVGEILEYLNKELKNQ